MNKKLRNLIATVIVVAMLGGMVAMLPMVLAPKDTGPTEQEIDREALQLSFYDDTSRILEVTVENEHGTFTALPTRGMNEQGSEANGLKIESIEKFPTQFTRFETLLNKCAYLIASRKFSDFETDLAPFGLSDPKISAKIKYSDKELQLFVGDRTPDESGYYVKLVGNDAVFIFHDDIYEIFSRGEKDYIDLKMLEPHPTESDPETGLVSEYAQEFECIELGGSCREEPITIEHDPVGAKDYRPYSMVLPKKISADDDAVRTLYSVITMGMTALDIAAVDPDAKTLARLGFDDPLATLRYQYRDAEYNLTVGSADEEHYMVMTGEWNIVYMISKNSLDFCEWQVADLFNKIIYIANVKDIKTFTITHGGKKYKLDVNIGADDKVAVTYGGKIISNEVFNTYYQNFLTIQHEDTGEKPSGDPVLSFDVEFTDSARYPDSINFIKESDRRYFYQVNGEGVFLIKSDRVNALISDIDNLINNQEIELLK